MSVLRPSRWLWLAFALLVAASMVVLLRACGLLLGHVAWSFCPAPAFALAPEVRETEVLRARVTTLEVEIARQQLACASVPKAPPAPLSLPTEAGPPRPQQTAALKPPPPPPPPPPKREPPSSVLKMPDKPTNDLSFLKGCWRTDSFKHDPAQFGEGVSTYCFDENGRGQLDFNRPARPGYACRPPAQARFTGSDLRIDDADTTCTDGSSWWADHLTCRRGSDGVALCSGTSNMAGRTHTWTVQLHRLP
ncbi:MAG TPA: hypothetical protein VMI56_13400 [Reyranella sp.]|nr:hypothetical protein [Reyranella sp.]